MTSTLKSALHSLSAGPPGQLADLVGNVGQVLLGVPHEAGDAVLDHLGHRSPTQGQDGRAAGHRLRHRQAERLGPVNGEEQRAR